MLPLHPPSYPPDPQRGAHCHVLPRKCWQQTAPRCDRTGGVRWPPAAFRTRPRQGRPGVQGHAAFPLNGGADHPGFCHLDAVQAAPASSQRGRVRARGLVSASGWTQRQRGDGRWLGKWPVGAGDTGKDRAGMGKGLRNVGCGRGDRGGERGAETPLDHLLAGLAAFSGGRRASPGVPFGASPPSVVPLKRFTQLPL